MKQHWENIHKETHKGFDITLAITYEDTHPRDMFEPDAVEEICERIDNGALIWFVARVTASRHGIELGRDYLGACLYENASDFIGDDSYLDLCYNAIKEAKNNLELLKQGEIA
jgi:hypothetical protein